MVFDLDFEAFDLDVEVFDLGYEVFDLDVVDYLLAFPFFFS